MRQNPSCVETHNVLLIDKRNQVPALISATARIPSLLKVYDRNGMPSIDILSSAICLFEKSYATSKHRTWPMTRHEISLNLGTSLACLFKGCGSRPLDACRDAQ